MANEDLLNHYKYEERSFAERVLEWSERVSNTHTQYITDFVDPRHLEIINNIVNSYNDLAMFFDGGYQNAERVRVLILDDYLLSDYHDVGITIFEINSIDKYNIIHHKDVLGALLNLGIKREKFGDILLSSSKQQFIVAKEIADYIQMEMKAIGKSKISLKEIERDLLCNVAEQYQVIVFTVSSLRVDSVISSIYNISRTKATEMINKNLLKVNWRIIDRVDKRLNEGDIISLRGYGRNVFIENQGITKKGRYRVKIRKII